MAGRRRTSEDIEKEIQALLRKKKEAEDWENRFVIVEPLITRILEIMATKGIDLSDGEVEHIVAPIRNVEKMVRERFGRNAKKNTKVNA